MSSYIGRHAEMYDLFYADKPYAEEAAFVDACLKKHCHTPAQKLLELACGTGRHAIQLEKFGYDVLATDYSDDMLNCARERGKDQFSTIEFRAADMRDLGVLDAQFDAAVCLFDSIGYVQTNEAIGDVFAGLRKNLVPGGLFVFEFWHAAAMLVGYDPVRVRRFAMPDGELLRISETTVDHAQSVCHVSYTIFEPHADQTYTQISETQTNRFFQIREMESLLHAGRFEPVKWFAGFSENEQIDENVWHVVCVARRAE